MKNSSIHPGRDSFGFAYSPSVRFTKDGPPINIGVGKPNKKAQTRLNGRLRAWDGMTELAKVGHKKPGSQKR